MSTTIYRPGNTVPISGIYNVVNAYGTYAGRQVTCVEDESFPPTIFDDEFGFTLHVATQHAS